MAVFRPAAELDGAPVNPSTRAHSPLAQGEPGGARRAGAGLPVALVALMLGHAAVDSCTGIWPAYKTLAGLDLARAGLIATVAGFAGNALQLLFGFLADRGLRRIVLCAGACASGAVAVVSLTDDATAHLLLVLLTMLGSGAFHPTAAGAAGTMGGARKGAFVGLFLASGYVGYALSQLVFTTLYAISPYATVVMMVFPIATGVAIALCPPPVTTAPASSARELVSAVLRELPRLSPLFIVQLLSTIINLALVFLLPDLLSARGAPSWMVTGGGHAALVVGGCLALIPSGQLADRFGARRVLLYSNLLSGAALAALLVFREPAVVLAWVGVFGVLNGATNVVVVAEGNRRLPAQAAVASALLMGLPWCIGSLAPAVAGFLAAPSRHGTPMVALWVMGLTVPLAALVAARMAQSDPER